MIVGQNPNQGGQLVSTLQGASQSHQPNYPQPKKSKRAGAAATVGKFLLSMKGLVFILAVTTAVFGGLFYMQYQENQDLQGSVAGVEAQQEFQRIVDNIRGLVNIEDDERVNIARVDDPSVLQSENPVFYEDVEAGHYLVVMPESQRVLIYDDENNKIVNFSSYSIRVDLIPEEEIPASEKPLSVEVRYSGNVSNENLQRVVEALQEASVNYNIVSQNPTSNSYDGITLVLLNREAKPSMSQNLVAHTGTNSITEELPAGEASSTADAVIILGSVPNQ